MNAVLSSGKIAHFADQKAATTAGGPATSGAWRQRVLNTTRVNVIDGCSLSSNQIALASGSYWLQFVGSFFGAAAEIEQRIYNVTDAAMIFKSSVNYGVALGGSQNSGSGLFTLASAKTIELQYRVQSTVNSNGLGVSNTWSEASVFAEVIIFKVS
jgi:hypothetical protein